MEEGYYFYIIQSQKHNRYYTGSCTDLKRRLDDHNRGNTKSTRKQGPWFLVYSETFSTLKEARDRERQVKKWKSKNLLEKLISDYKV